MTRTDAPKRDRTGEVHGHLRYTAFLGRGPYGSQPRMPLYAASCTACGQDLPKPVADTVHRHMVKSGRPSFGCHNPDCPRSTENLARERRSGRPSPTADRDADVRAAYAGGKTLAEVAAAFGLSLSAVHRIVNQGEPAADLATVSREQLVAAIERQPASVRRRVLLAIQPAA